MNWKQEDDCQYYVIEDFLVRKASMAEWTECLNEGESTYTIEKTEFKEGPVVWTCFVGYDHRDPPNPALPPLLFETMVIGIPECADQELTATLADAKSCHYRHVQEVRDELQKRDRGY